MIHWGILGYGRIAKRFEKGLSYSQKGELYAIATRSNHVQTKETHPDIKIYDNYEDMFHDENIDAIYIAVPHKYHYQWAKEALLNHKAVLVEKPSTLSAIQTKELCDLSKENNTFFMEAMKTRFIPMVNELKNLLEQGIIGHIQYLENSFCGHTEYNEQSYLFDKDQGGALYDVGVYNIAMMLDLISQPLLDMKVDYTKKYDVDVDDKITLIYDDCQAVMNCATMGNPDTSMIIIGDKGKMELKPFYRPIEVTVTDLNGKQDKYQKPYVFDDFYGEIEEVHRGILEECYESDRYTHKEMVQCIEIMEKAKGMMV